MRLYKQINWLTQTSLLLALAILVQTFFRMWFPESYSQFIIGSLINLFLILATLLCGISSGLIIAVLTPFIAFMMGQVAYPQQIIIVAFGNSMIVLAFWFFCRIKIFEKINILARIVLSGITGSLLKFGALWLGMNKIFIPLVLNHDLADKAEKLNKMVTKITAAFGIPQLITALTGSLLALILFPMLYKILKKDRQS